MSSFSKQATAECASVDLSVSTGLEKDVGKSQWPPGIRVPIPPGHKLPAVLIYYLQVINDVYNDDFQFSHI